MKTLIVIDMQNDFVTGSLGTKEAQAIVPNVKKKMKEYADAYENIMCTMDTHEVDYLNTQEGKLLPVEHCIKGTPGWELVDDISGYPAIRIEKVSFGFNNWKYFNVVFEEAEEIELVGVCTDICVVSNALILKALYPETKITVDANCCAGVTPELHEAAMNVMRSCQINVIGDGKND